METGGVLVGFHDSRLDAVVITKASGPGPRAHHGPFTFNRDREFCQAFIDRCADESSGRLDFVGEWHKHRERDPWPSPTDRTTYMRLAVDEDAQVDRPVILISGTRVVQRDGDRAADEYVRVNAFVFRADGFVPRPIRWLPDEAYLDLLEDARTEPER